MLRLGRLGMAMNTRTDTTVNSLSPSCAGAHGFDIAKMSERQMAALRRPPIGMLIEMFGDGPIAYAYHTAIIWLEGPGLDLDAPDECVDELARHLMEKLAGIAAMILRDEDGGTIQ